MKIIAPLPTLLRFVLVVGVLTLSLLPLNASELTISNIRTIARADIADNPVSVVFDIRWENSWHNAKNHDAAWVFMKFNAQYNNHVKLLPEDPRMLIDRAQAGQPSFVFSPDSLGFFLIPPEGHRGEVNYKVQIRLETSQNMNWPRLRAMKVFGVEMVYIPEGPFTVGSPDTSAIKRASFYESDGQGNPRGLKRISSEAAIDVGASSGDLYYWSESSLYNGDQLGPVPAAFPKGFNDFYLMKYELTQGQYADFLNDLPDNWTYTRSPLGGRGYHEKRGTLQIRDGQYHAERPNRPMNHVSFTDALAYSDWAALRPITELEYEKAARGPGTPIDGEFVWGTSTYDLLERYVDAEGDLILANGTDEGELDDDNRARYGASYFWVMDLSGSVWEKVITIGNPIGRQFQGTHGDGRLHFGHADNPDWPTSDDEIGGFGYRGGGYYTPGTEYSDFNPHSPIGYRYYGAWSGGPRYLAYGYRAGRTAP